MQDDDNSTRTAHLPGTARVGAVTLAQVAQEAGVSTITASRALGNPRMVSADTVERVKLAAQRIGYVPNLLAGGLKSRRSRMVAMLLPTIAGSPFLRTVQALTDALSEQGYQVMLGQTAYNDDRELELLDAIIGRRPDGIVVAGVIHSEQARLKLKASGIPVVETWEMTANPVDMLVGVSLDQVGKAIANYLWDSGRRRFGIVSAHDSRGLQRCEGFLQELKALSTRHKKRLGKIPQHIVQAPSNAISGRQGLAALLQERPDLDAVYCGSVMLALGAIVEAQVLGIKVPEQLAVICYGDVDLAEATAPSITTVRVDDIAIGREAARFILARAEGEVPQPSQVDVGFTIVQRESA